MAFFFLVLSSCFSFIIFFGLTFCFLLMQRGDTERKGESDSNSSARREDAQFGRNRSKYTANVANNIPQCLPVTVNYPKHLGPAALLPCRSDQKINPNRSLNNIFLSCRL